MADYLYDPLTDKYVLIPDDITISPQENLKGTNSNPPSTKEKVTAQSIQEGKVIENLVKKIEGTVEVFPDTQKYKVEQMNKIRGVGSQFSGYYYTSRVTVAMTKDSCSINLSVLRDNTNLLVEESKTVPVLSQGFAQREQIKLADSAKHHVVSSGETLSHIAVKYYKKASKWNIIWEANKDMLIKRDARNRTTPGKWIYPGQNLVIP